MNQNPMNSLGVQNPSPEMPGSKNTITLRVPKMNIQVIVLSLVAVITLFQTYQLMQIGNKTTSVNIKSNVPAASSSGSGASTNSNAPESMVGGC